MEIASVLARGARISIFDEPEAGIDLWSFSNLISVFQEMRESLDGTLIIISHRMSTIQNANCIYVLEKGVVAQRGSHAELMQQGGLYRELVTRQQAMEVAE